MSLFSAVTRNLTSTLIALSLTACGTSESPANLPADQQAAPVNLTTSAAIRGEQLTFTVDGMTPGDTAHIVVSLSEGISCPPQARGACFNLSGRITYLGSVTGDDLGVGTLNITTPTAPITTAYAQAYLPAIDDRSNVATIQLFDGDADEDADGLTNAEEMTYGTDPMMADTDLDGLTDGEEVFDFSSDPLVADTDADGCDDGEDPNPLTIDDLDQDGVCDVFDLCTGDDATGDTDEDGICTSDDMCPDDPMNDANGNGICDGEEPAFTYLGGGECRQGNGSYPAKFSRGYYDLSPHTTGTNADLAIARCQDECASHADWCVAAEVVTRDIWSTPECRLVTDHATFTAAGFTWQNDQWGGTQTIDGTNYQTYCGGGSTSCTATDIGSGVTLNGRDGYHCYTMN